MADIGSILDHSHRPGRRRARWPHRAIGLVLASLVLVGAGAGFGASAQACDRLLVPSVDIDRCVVAGFQDELDAGHTVLVDVLTEEPVFWIAGHRTSHGGTFHRLTEVGIGAVVTFRGEAYRIEEYQLLDRNRPEPGYAWIDEGRPAVVLQTSAWGSHVHTWRAFRTVMVDQMSAAPAAGSPSVVAVPDEVPELAPADAPTIDAAPNVTVAHATWIGPDPRADRPVRASRRRVR